MRPSASQVLPLLPALTFAAVVWSCAPDAPHDAGEDFPLEGKHDALPCEACHGTDGFEALPTDCASCHEVDRPPDHYPGDCGECHTAFGWLSFGSTTTTTTGNPHETVFPLIGPHDVACSTCHVGEGYAGLDMACETCHEAERPPYHYSGTCAECHPISAWTDGVVHRVPLPHHTADCASCHPDAAVRTEFTCTDGCHDDAVTAPQHAAVPGYVHDSTLCADCHFPT